MRSRFLAGCALFLAACTTAPVADDGGEVPDGGSAITVAGLPVPGGYQLSATVVDDDCGERTDGWSGEQAVTSSDSAHVVTIPVPNPAFGADPLRSITRQEMKVGGDDLVIDGQVCGASLRQFLKIDSIDERGFTVSLVRQWSDVPAKVDPGCTQRPKQDGLLQAKLRYDLVLGCSQSCVLMESFDAEGKDTVSCGTCRDDAR